MAWDDTKTDAVDVLHAADYNEIVSQVKSRATKTDSDLTLYVYEDATGDGDGSSKANGFTSLQAAIDAIPDVAQNVTIIVSKGSTNYIGDTTTIQKASVKSLTIRGEFYAYDACDANAVAGKIVDASADFSDFAVGDRVVCTKYSGAVGASAITDYFYATITEVGSGYVQTSEETKVPTTGWRYLINQTVFDGDNGITRIVRFSYPVICSIRGIEFYNIAYGIQIYYKSDVSVFYSIFKECTTGIYIGDGNPTARLYNSAILSDVAGSYGIICDLMAGACQIQNTLISVVYAGLFGAFSRSVSYCGIFKSTYGVSNLYNIIGTKLTSSYIASTCTNGAYGYNITLVSCTNNAATPVYNLTSGGSIEEWDGQALPSIDDATGGQVLALKSDKSALEFATVSGGGMDPIVASLIFG